MSVGHLGCVNPGPLPPGGGGLGRGGATIDGVLSPSSQSPLRLRRIFDLKGRGGERVPSSRYIGRGGGLGRGGYINKRLVRAAQVLLFFMPIFCFALLSHSSFAEPVSVFTSILPSSYLVERIGGDAVRVSTLVEPGQSPETYEPTPRQMALLSGSQLYFRVGLPFENVWMDKIASMNPKMKVVDLRQGIALREIEGHHHEEGEETSSEAGHEEHGKDPHLWLSLRNAAIMAETIAGALEQCTPELKEQFQKNLTDLLAEMKRADDDVQRLLAPLQGRRFMVFHPAWGYFADDYGLEQIPIEIEGKSPNARALAQMIDRAKAEKIQVIFVQKQFSAVSAEAVAKAIGGKVVAMDPLSPDYVNNFRRIAQTLAEGMQ